MSDERSGENVATAGDRFGGRRGTTAGMKWYGSVVERARLGTASPREAIRAYCIVCSCEQKAEITNCTVKSCPLYLYRPYQRGAE